MSKKTLIIPPEFMPPNTYHIHGKSEKGVNTYTCMRLSDRAVLPIVFDMDAEAPDDFNAYFTACLGKASEP